MRAGRLDRLVTVQRRTVTLSDSGAEIEAWTTVIARHPASIWTPQAGDETFSQPQLLALEKVEWLIRYSSAVAALTPLDRLVYPALSDASPEDIPNESKIYDIVAVHEFGRREGLRVVTARRPDAS